jgi:hypothetical protein
MRNCSRWLRLAHSSVSRPLTCRPVLGRELELALDLVERLNGQLSARLWVLGLLESLAHEAKGFLGLEDAPGCLLRLVE